MTCYKYKNKNTKYRNGCLWMATELLSKKEYYGEMYPLLKQGEKYLTDMMQTIKDLLDNEEWMDEPKKY